MKFKTAALVITIILFAGIYSCSPEKNPVDTDHQNEISVGALLSLTGNWSSLGNTSQAALNIAESEINSYLEQVESNLRIKIKIEDTKLDTTLALQKLKTLTSQGIKVFIGPQSSAEIGTIKNFADQNNLLIISQGSTAGKYAIADDNIFRFCPSDSLEGNAMANLMWKEGIKCYVWLSSNDAGNMGLQVAAKTSFQNLGGTIATGYVFEQSQQDYDIILQDVKDEILRQKLTYGEAVAVYVTTFNQIIPIFKEAVNDPELSSVKWYGSDGVVLINELVSDTAAARFAELTGYPCPTYGLDESNRFKWETLASQIKTQTGYEPDAFGLASYDALWASAMAYLSINGSNDFNKLKAALIHSANSYYGATGATVLNEAGDRKFGYYDFWGVRKDGGIYKWKLIGHSEK